MPTDTPFTTFAFAATDAPTTRTMPARLAEIHNVKDFGATGDGVTDDLSAIQAAVDWQTSTGHRGTIFFPAGTYHITDSIEFDWTGEHSIIFRGVGNASIISGSFNGFLFDRPTEEASARAGDRFENLSLINTNTTALTSGCVRWQSANGVSFFQCKIAGMAGILCDNSVYNFSCISCDFPNNGLGTRNTTSIGIIVSTGGGGLIAACDITGYGYGIRAGRGIAIIGCRFEMQTARGIVIGMDKDGGDASAGGAFIAACSFEANVIGIYAFNMNNSQITACGIQGEHFSGYMDTITRNGTTTNGSAVITGLSATADLAAGLKVTGTGIQAGSYILSVDSGSQITLTRTATASATVALDFNKLSTHGLRIRNGSNNVYQGLNVAGQFSTAAIDMTDLMPGSSTFIEVTATNSELSPAVIWNMPSQSQNKGVRFLSCAGAPDNSRPFNTLPSVPTEGEQFIVNNSSVTTFRGTANGSGASYVEVTRLNGAWVITG